MRVGRKIFRVIDDLPFGWVASKSDAILHRWCGCDHIHAVFVSQSLHKDVHVQKTKEATSQATAESRACFSLHMNTGIREAQFRHGFDEVLQLRRLARVYAGENLGRWLLKTGNGFSQLRRGLA